MGLGLVRVECSYNYRGVYLYHFLRVRVRVWVS